MIRRILNNIKVLSNEEQIVLKYSKGKYTHKNIGDALNVFLFEQIFKKNVINYKEILNVGFPPVYSFIGSVLDNSAVRNLTVIGSGFKSGESKLPIPPKKVVATRGPLTREKLLKNGVNEVPEIYGDPAILLPHYFDVKSSKKYKMGIIPHYTDKDLPILERWKKDPEVKFIDVYASMETFIRDLKSCEFTISSSLHGVILSHAYGISSGWIKLSDNLAGGDFKFRDYYLSVGEECTSIHLDKNISLYDLKQHCILPNMTNITGNLKSALDNFQIQ